MPSSVVRRFAAALSLAIALVAPTTAAAKSGPVLANFSTAFVYGVVHPNLDPAGANDFTCRPTTAHPRPVVLLHGSYANPFNSFAALAPAIHRQGYCVFAPSYGQDLIPGVGGAKAIRSSSRQVAAYVDRVLAATGASQVDVVGYSQGALVARAYLKYDGGTDAVDPSKNKVASLIGLSGDNHGTTLGGLTGTIDRYRLRPLVGVLLGQAATDQIAGSPFLTDLNAGSETLPGVRYTMLATRTDEISAPFRNALLIGAPGISLTNIVLQTNCPTDFSDHFNITYSRRTAAIVLRALDPTVAQRVPCQVLLPGI